VAVTSFQSIQGISILKFSCCNSISGILDIKVYAVFIPEFTDFTVSISFAQSALMKSSYQFSSNSFSFSSSDFSQKSNTPEKSGSIINTVGKSVSLVTISSICLVTHHIRKSGNGDILLFCI
jgi:hypothetical protein